MMAGEAVNNAPQLKTSNSASSGKQHTSTTPSAFVKFNADPSSVGVDLKFNPLYYITIPGLIKLVQLLFTIICLGCGAPAMVGFAHFFLFVAAVTFIVTLLLCFDYLVTLKSTLYPNVPWLLVELAYTALASILYLVASLVQLIMTTSYNYYAYLQMMGFYDAYIVSGVFGMFNFLAFGAGAVFLFLEWKACRPTAPAQ